MKSFIERAGDYAHKVLAGEIDVAETVVQACQRFADDCERDDIYMSDDANRWCAFLETLPHVKGQWAARRESLKLSDWQIFAVVNLYGWKWTRNDRRRFREAYITVPRKNGKSFLFGGLGLGHLCIDGEVGAEVYCGASTEAQAWEVFRPARQICSQFDMLREHYMIEVNAKSLQRPGDGSRFLPVIGKPGDGSSPSAAICDEFHEHADSDQVDTFKTGMGARENPMLLCITTAGFSFEGPAYEKEQECRDILKGTIEDDSIFALIYGLDPDDDWSTIEAVKKANPNYGISVDEEFLQTQLDQARRSSVAQNAFRTKHCNEWVGARTAWMNMLSFQACRRNLLSLDDYKGQRCIVGIDLASTNDLAAMAVLFPFAKPMAAFCKHYLPEDAVYHANTKYRGWHLDGWITATPGARIDYAYIEEDLLKFATEHQVAAVAFDPFQATQFSTRMDQAGLPMIQFGQTVRNFSEPMKEFERAVAERRIVFQMDPVLMWAAGNVHAKLDFKDNIFPTKATKDGKGKIDPIVALIMAYGIWVQEQPTAEPAIVML